MTAVAIAPLGRTEVLQWLAPAPLWDNLPIGAGSAGLVQPWITELTQDKFVDQFTEMLSGTSGSPTDLASMDPALTVGGVAGAPYRLFQPLSQRFYVVSATLVCRRPGIPDHSVKPAQGEKTMFVMRRLNATGDEEAFIPGPGNTATWVAATGAALQPGEKEYPMHPAPVAPYALPGTTTSALGLDAESGIGRTIFYGYIPVSAGEKLKRPMADPVQTYLDLQAAPGGPPGGYPDPILLWLYQRVILPWNQLAGPTAASNVGYASLYLLLDLGDWLKQHLPDVYDAVTDGTAVSGAYDDLVTAFESVTVNRSAGGSTNLKKAIADTVQYAPLLTGDDIAGPNFTYDLSDNSLADHWLKDAGDHASLAYLATQALAVAPGRPVLPPELEGMIQEAPVVLAGSPKGAGTTYVIRTVFHHDPCQPVLSEATHRFELARAMDGDAPARKVLLQMPDITHMRKFNRGVAIETPPALQKILNALTPDVLKGDPVRDSGLALGFICSFSIQIIFLVAFIVMFIFLILLNICFFWMPFLKICFPIPVPASSDKGPTP
jgi:hypothetical protein